MRLIYTIGIYIYTLGIRVVAMFGHEKARLMVNGWKRWPEAVSKLDQGRWTAWFHAASLGEFEQARPVLEEYRRRHPDHQVLVTFFSPSGYEVRKNYAQADALCYLPMDTPRNVRRFILAVNPDTVFFVKYEFWYNYLKALRQWGAKTYIFSTIFRPGQYFFKWYGGWFRKQLKVGFAHLFVQNEESLHLLESHGIGHCSLAGDTRFDRVHQIALADERNEVVEEWLNAPRPLSPSDSSPERGAGEMVLVCGSTWPPDEEILARFAKRPPRPMRLILAPHVISEEHLQQIEKLFPDSVRYSSFRASSGDRGDRGFKGTRGFRGTSGARVLIIDNIGILSKLYRYADVAYIGGGFGVGIHNILEAVTFGKPVLFGPNYHKFQEARDIIARGGGWSVGSADQLMHTLGPLVADPDKRQKPSQACTEYMQQNLGSTEKILAVIKL